MDKSKSLPERVAELERHVAELERELRMRRLLPQVVEDDDEERNP